MVLILLNGDIPIRKLMKTSLRLLSIFNSNVIFRRRPLFWFLLLITLQGCQSVPLCEKSKGGLPDQKGVIEKLKQKSIKEKSKSHMAKPSGKAAIELKEGGEARTFLVFADERKNYSGVKLVKGKRYSFHIEDYSHRWFDEGVDAHPICGWRDQANTIMRKIVRFFGGLFSYSWSDDLMVLLGVVEGPGDDENLQFSFTMDKKSIKESSNEREIVGEFNSPGTGELYVFANDAKSDLFKDFYKNNVGYLKVTLELAP